MYLLLAQKFFIKNNEDIDKLKTDLFDNDEFNLQYTLTKEEEILKRFPFLNN